MLFGEEASVVRICETVASLHQLLEVEFPFFEKFSVDRRPTKGCVDLFGEVDFLPREHNDRGLAAGSCGGGGRCSSPLGVIVVILLVGLARE